jgi:prepilin-type processing-associated H-X9-DG protein
MRLLCAIAVLAVCIETAPGQEKRPVAKSRPAASPARHVSRQNLLAYLEFDGLDAHADAWRTSAAYKLLRDTKLGSVLEDLALQGIELIQESTTPERRVGGAEVVGLLKHIAHHGFAVGATRKGREDARFVAVLRHGDRPEFKRLLETLGAALKHEEVDKKPDDPANGASGRALNRLGASGIWLVEKGDLILASATSVDEILAVQSGGGSSALDHPIRLRLLEATDGIQPAAIGFFDMASLAPLTPDAVDLGLDGLERLELQWGFQDAALVTRLRAVAPEPRRGVLALLDQPTFGVNALPPLPPNLTSLFALSVDPAKTYDQIDSMMNRIHPPAPPEAPNTGILARHGIDLRKELLGHVGPPIVLYAQAPQGIDKATVASLLMSRVAGFTVAARIRHETAVLRAIDSLVKSFNPMLREYLRGIPRNRVAPSLAFLKFRKLAGPLSKYELELPPDSLPAPYATKLRPTIVVSRDQLVVSASTLAAEQAAAAHAHGQPKTALIPAVNRLPGEMIYLGLTDPRAGTAIFTRALPIVVRQINAEIALAQRRAGKIPKDVYMRLDPGEVPEPEDLDRLLFPSSTTLTVDRQGAILTHRAAILSLTSPAVGAAAVAYLVPAVRSSLEAARRVQCVNNLKQIALALHNFHASNNAFPRPAILDQKGKPLLSWRVAILPYIEQQTLYDKFKLDEPWDSPHNQALLKEMPPIFRCPIRTKGEPFTTTYRVLVGKGALFEKDTDIAVADVTDGTSNTLMVVEAKDAVPWSKPEDLSFDPAAAPSLVGAGSPHPGGFNASMADGSVRFFKTTIDVKVLRSLITRAGGEVIGPGAF